MFSYRGFNIQYFSVCVKTKLEQGIYKSSAKGAMQIEEINFQTRLRSKVDIFAARIWIL